MRDHVVATGRSWWPPASFATNEEVAEFVDGGRVTIGTIECRLLVAKGLGRDLAVLAQDCKALDVRWELASREV